MAGSAIDLLEDQRRACKCKTHTAQLVAFLLAALLAFAAPSLASSGQHSWRPYNKPNVLVTLGMSKGEVLLKAGQPQTTETISLGIDGTPSVTIWTYIRTGHNASVTSLTFKGNRLVTIDYEIVR